MYFAPSVICANLRKSADHKPFIPNSKFPIGMPIEAIPEFPEQTQLERGHRDVLVTRFRAIGPVISEMSFSYLWCWKPHISTTLSRFSGAVLVFFRNAKTGETVALPPATDDSALAAAAAEAMLTDCVAGFQPAAIVRAPAGLAELFADHDGFTVGEERDRADYVYAARDLRELPGQRYHSKRNHIKRFRGACPDARYETMDAPLSAACVEFTREWLARHPAGDRPDLQREVEVSVRMLENYRWLGLTGGAMVDGERVVAFALGERLSDDTFVVRVEKADTDVSGSYQTINREFARAVPEDCRWINREQDLGIPGLRRAKKSYHPDHLVRKYRIGVRQLGA